MNYLLSYRDLSCEQIAVARDTIHQAIAEYGSFQVTKASGSCLAAASIID